MSISEMPTKDQYLQLLNLSYEVIQSLKGKKTLDFRWPDCQQLAAKLFIHSATVYWLGEEGTKAPVPYSTKGASFFDFPSVAILTRAIFETYLTMFEVFFEPKTDDDFEFHHALWQLSGFIIRVDYTPADPRLQDEFTKAQNEIQEMKSRIQNTEKFKSLKSGEQRDVLKGKGLRSWKSVAKAAGFGEKTIQKMYTYYSGFVHADGLSATQIMAAQNRQDQVEHIEIHMRVIMLVLSKVIVEYAGKFPEAQTVCNNDPDAYQRAVIWSEVASRLP